MHTLILPVPESSTLSLVALGTFLLLLGAYIRRWLPRPQTPAQTVKELLALTPTPTTVYRASNIDEPGGGTPRRGANGSVKRAVRTRDAALPLPFIPPTPASLRLSWRDVNYAFATDDELLYCVSQVLQECRTTILDSEALSKFWDIHDELDKRAAHRRAAAAAEEGDIC
jgi:hypothetical protein